MVKYQKFDDLVVSMLSKDTKLLNEYINTAINDYMETRNKQQFLFCLNNIVKSCGGFQKLAAKTGKTRQAIYHALSPKGNPTLDTFFDIITNLNFKFNLIKMSDP